MHTVRRYIGQGNAAALLCIMHVRYILFSKYEHTRVRHVRCRRDLTNAAQPRHEMQTFNTTSSKCSFFYSKASMRYRKRAIHQHQCFHLYVFRVARCVKALHQYLFDSIDTVLVPDYIPVEQLQNCILCFPNICKATGVRRIIHRQIVSEFRNQTRDIEA